MASLNVFSVLSDNKFDCVEAAFSRSANWWWVVGGSAPVGWSVMCWWMTKYGPVGRTGERGLNWCGFGEAEIGDAG